LNVPAGDKIKFPAANVMIKQLAYNYETKTYLNRIELTGEITKVGEIRNSMNYEAKYTTNKSYIQFPLLFQSSSTKSFVYTYTGAIENGTKTGSNKYDVPGFGRLKMPDGTIYDSVYLIISTELTLETGKSPGKSETFWWYSNKYKGPIAVVTYFYGYNSSSSSFIKPPPSVIFQKKPMEAPKPSNVIQTVALKFAIYPNPAVSTTTIKSDVIITSLTVISIDGKAQIVKENVESKDVVLDVSAIKSGIYFIRITDSNGNMGIRKIYIHK